jgi:hypothetical protein
MGMVKHREDFGFFVSGNAQKLLHNMLLADRSFSGRAMSLRHGMCSVAHGESGERAIAMPVET